ncbi:MAG: hypothetical protein ACRED5_18250 [Propylenella sp.]
MRAEAESQARELLAAIEAAEGVIVTTIERECEALRAGRLLAADALRTRLRDAAKLYLNVSRAVRASLWTLERILPGAGGVLEERRAAFSALLKVELAVLAAERAAADPGLHFADAAPAFAFAPSASPTAASSASGASPIPNPKSPKPVRRRHRLRKAS